MSGAFLTSSGPLGFLISLPPTTKGLTAALLACSILIQVARMTIEVHDLKSVFRGSKDDSLAFPWLVVVPGYAFFRPWTLVTAALTEAGLFEVRSDLFI